MDITLDKSSNTEAILKVVMNEPDYHGQVEKKVKEYSKKATLKGFRPGKVPPGIIKKMYGKAIKVEEINKLLSESVNDYIKNNDLKIIGEPLPEIEKVKDIDWDTQEQFEFEYKIGLVDEFKLSIPEELDFYEIDVNDQIINETIGYLQERYADITHPEESGDSDVIHGTITKPGSEEDFEKKAYLELKSIKEEEKNKFIGLKKEDAIEFDPKAIHKNEDSLASFLGVSKEDTEAFEGAVSLKVEGINRVKKSELNQEFYDKIFSKDQVKTEEEFKEKLRDTLKDNYKKESELLFEKQLKDYLIENTKMEIPDQFLKEFLKVQSEGKINDENLGEHYDNHVQELKWNLIVNKVSEEANMKPESEQILEKAKELISGQFAASGISAEMLGGNLDSYVQNYLSAENGKNYLRMYEETSKDLVINHLKEKIKFNNKVISRDKFQEISSN